MKKFKDKFTSWFADFKKFISKGNILDMAVGVILGTAFSAIVNGLVNFILMPLITSAIPGGLTGLVTVLNPEKALVKPEEITEGMKVVSYWGQTYNADIVNVINWGSFINAIINFLIISLTLFIIVKIVKRISGYTSITKRIAKAYTRKEKKAMRKEGLSFTEIRKKAEEKVKLEEAEAMRKAKEEADKKDTELKVLQDIRKLLTERDQEDKNN